MFCRSDDVIILNNITDGNNLTVEYLVRATYNSQRTTVPQVTVEATLDEYKENITQEIGVEVLFTVNDEFTTVKSNTRYSTGFFFVKQSVQLDNIS